MSCTLVFALVSAIALLNVAAAEKETIFERTFKTLHQEPPPPAAATLNRAVNYLTIEQKVDNFNATDTRTWQMRYIANDEFYIQGAPFFVFMGGEWEIPTTYVTSGHFYDLAREHNAYLFCTEHRYYGQSRPTSNLDNENIQYLSVRQALADLAHFIEEQRVNIPGANNSKVILAGRSYSATMVTYFKKLYPELATGVWASSGPLLTNVDFYEYKEITGQSIRLIGGEQCYNRIQNGLAAMENLFGTKRGAEVKALLKLCNAFDEYNDLDMWSLFYQISDTFAMVVQSHNPGQIEGMCDKIAQGENDIIGVASYLLQGEMDNIGGSNYLLSIFSTNSCNPLDYKSLIGTLMDSNNFDGLMRQWTYQTCNEFGWFQTSTSRKQPFGTKFPTEFFIQMCEDVFGKKFTKEFITAQVAATNRLFGGLEPNLENIYFTHGQLDPWRAVGIQDGPQATVLPLLAHCKDLTSISAGDSAELLASKLRIGELVRTWLGANSSAISKTNNVELIT